MTTYRDQKVLKNSDADRLSGAMDSLEFQTTEEKRERLFTSSSGVRHFGRRTRKRSSEKVIQLYINKLTSARAQPANFRCHKSAMASNVRIHNVPPPLIDLGEAGVMMIDSIDDVSGRGRVLDSLQCTPSQRLKYLASSQIPLIKLSPQFVFLWKCILNIEQQCQIKFTFKSHRQK